MFNINTVEPRTVIGGSVALPTFTPRTDPRLEISAHPMHPRMPTRILSVVFLLAGTLSAEEKPEDTEVWTPVPPVVSTSGAQGIPSDAIALFDRGDLSAWRSERDGEPGWAVKDGILTVKAGGGIVTKQGFGDCQLHLEWRSPAPPRGEGQNRGNSGVYLQRRYEVQILDSHQNATYVNGQAGAIYKQHPPLVNASRPPGEWQVYDIVFRAPRFTADGGLLSPAAMTVLHNGVLIQNHVELAGPTAWVGRPPYKVHPYEQPLLLQNHGAPVSFRNIWIRPLGEEAPRSGAAGAGAP